ncbi:MAG TPA: 4-hydroxy-3-methylbut-2-enyl diphosphate reductase, partial [Rikenellaceae bacterium]|nr:4-hydroxy-3-methylbut-2-enyl diphosphate reductase [Rikenellaceae bacterium]
RTYHISDSSELTPEWFHDGDKVGVCGATSTPGWLLEQVAERIFCRNIHK